MFSLPVFVGLDYHQKVIQVCVMDQTRKILANQSVENDPATVLRYVAQMKQTPDKSDWTDTKLYPASKTLG